MDTAFARVAYEDDENLSSLCWCGRFGLISVSLAGGRHRMTLRARLLKQHSVLEVVTDERFVLPTAFLFAQTCEP